MTPKFSLIVGIAVAALVLAAPAVGMIPTLDGGDSGYAPSAGSTLLFDGYKTEGARADFWNYDESGQRIANTSPGVAPQNLATQFASTGGPTVVATDSGRGDWPQIGIGFGLGIVAVLGLLLVMRHSRIRPLAH